ncbi:MAG TPA: copper chaperone PCu(A)C [Steroidobacteraceae bacterium]
MRKRSPYPMCLALLLASVALHAASLIQLTDPWARPTPPGTRVGAVYFTLVNTSAVADRLIGLSSPLADKVEIHQTVSEGGIMSMRALSSLECPPGKVLKISPGGLHVMLLGLKAPLVVGDQVPLSLNFRDAGMLSLKVPVQAREE